jgi:hypothetical protein
MKYSPYKKLYIPTIIFSVFAIICCDALAAPRVVKKSQLKKTSISIKIGKRLKKYNISCLKTTPGTAKLVKKKLIFTSFRDAELKLKRSRQTASVKSQIQINKSLHKEGTKACKILQNPPSDSPPSPNPDHLSLEPYTGSFGIDEVHLLYNRFGFGATQSDMQNAINSGLAATIDRLLTPVSEPEIDSAVNDMTCDNWLSSDPNPDNQNTTCSSSNINDFSRTGIRTGLLYRFINSKNTFFNRLAFFLMDERMATSHNAARDCEKHAIKTYLSSIFNAAYSGDYIQYMRSMNNDHLLHLRWLDGGTNRGGIAGTPNENYAREFWELGTVGPTALDGSDVYGDLDIAQSALAFTGFDIDESYVNGNWLCLSVYVPMFHTNGPKTIFIGKPYQSVVDSAEDVLQATTRHPRMAEHLAEDIWKTFINPYATSVQIQNLAQLIRNNNYNLIPVFRTIMSSKAVFAPASRRSLIKHPLDIVIGFTRNTGFPLYYRNYDYLLQRLEQQVLNAPSVFGWDEKYLSGQQMQIEWWNAFVDNFININTTQVKQSTGWSYYDRFVSDLYNSGQRSSLSVITRVAQDLGVAINSTQISELDQLMNYYLTRSGCPSSCGGLSYRLIRNQYDTNPLAAESGYDWNGQRRIRLLITALMELPEARLK